MISTRKNHLAYLCYLLLSCQLISVAFATDFFVATNGSDENPGSLDKPLSTIMQAQKLAAPGDTVFIRGGIYKIMEHQISRTYKIWAYVNDITKSGQAGRPINYWAYGNEKPVFDFSAVTPELRVIAFHVTASWVHFKGIEVTGVQVKLTTHSQSECFENTGSNNIYENLKMHHNQAIGFYLTQGSNNLILNCDAFENHDFTSGDLKGGNVDGFGAHPRKDSVNNIFRGCRAWFNSDDGYDCINAHESVKFENCQAFYNGYSADFKSLGDGNGFKIGGFGSAPVERLPQFIPRHLVIDCLAVKNKAYGFYANHHLTGGDWINNRAFKNKINFTTVYAFNLNTLAFMSSSKAI